MEYEIKHYYRVKYALFCARQSFLKEPPKDAGESRRLCEGAEWRLQCVLTKKMPTEKPEIFSGFLRFSPFSGTLRAKCDFS